MKQFYFFIGICIALFSFYPAQLQAQAPDYLWAQQAVGVNNSNDEYSRAIATDGSGNSYITGYFKNSIKFGNITLIGSGGVNKSDIFIAKYDAAGAVLWAKSAGGKYDDEGLGIAVDASGNVFVTGTFQGIVTFGSTSLTNYSGSRSIRTDIFIAKYNSSGTLEWAQKAGGSNDDYGYGIATDASGNAYLTGSFTGSASFGSVSLTSNSFSSDAFIAKYNSAGVVQWAIKAGGSGAEVSNSIAVDGSGNAYITGYFTGSTTFDNITSVASSGGTDVFIAKYNTSGVYQWMQKAGGVENDNGRGIALDASGNPHITGTFEGSATFGSLSLSCGCATTGAARAFLVKYNTAGVAQWARKPDGQFNSTYGYGIAIDGSGNCYITGGFYTYSSTIFGNSTLTGSGGYDTYIAKYNASGVAQWGQKIGGTFDDYSFGVGVDNSGNVYATGYFGNSAIFGSQGTLAGNGFDLYVTKLNPSNGTFSWRTNPTGFKADNKSQSIAVDASGNTYTTGSFRGSATFGTTTITSSSTYQSSSGATIYHSDIFVAKYDPSGSLLWVQKSEGANDKAGLGIAVDGNGNAYITGYFMGTTTFNITNSITSTGSTDIFIAKFNTSGVFQWAQKAGSPGADRGQGIALDPSGNPYITGYFTGTAAFGNISLTGSGSQDIFTTKYDSNGIVQWAQKAGGSNSDVGNSIAVDAQNNVYVTGTFVGSANFGSVSLSNSGYPNIFIAKYDQLGTIQWAQKAGGFDSSESLGIAVDAAGNAVITGYFEGTATFSNVSLTSNGFKDIFIAKYNLAGNLQWAKNAGGSSEDNGRGVSMDASGNAYLTGDFFYNATFGTFNLSTTNDGFSDAFIAKYSSSGTVDWVKQAGGKFANIGYGIAVNGQGNSFITGTFDGEAIFGSTTLNTTGTEIFIAKLDKSNLAPTNITLSDSTIFENVAANTVIGTFTTTDPDVADTHTYSLVAGTGDVDNSEFTLTTAGSLSINNSPDFEAKPAYAIRVRTTDLKGAFFEKAFSVTVKDLNDTVSWTGAVSSNWNDTGNWSAGKVPAISDDVIILAGLPNYPAIDSIATANNVYLGAGATSLTLLSGGDLTVAGNFTLSAGANLIMDNSGLNSLTINKAIVNSGGTVSPGTGTIVFTSPVSTTIPDFAYYNLVLAGDSGTVLTTTGNLTVTNNLVLSNANFTLQNDFTITANGNLQVDASQTGTGKIVLAGGTTAHQVSGSKPIYNLELNDTLGAVLSSSITIDSLLTFTAGSLTALNGMQLILNGALANEDENRMFVGELVKKVTIDSTVISQDFGNIGVTFTNTGGGHWGEVTIERTTGPGAAIASPIDPTAEGILRNWHISPEFTTVNKPVDLTLSWLASEDNGLTFINDKAQVWKSVDNGLTWIATGGTQDIITNGNLKSVTVQTNSFSLWTISDATSPLPVTLLSFNGKAETTGNLLTWATATEQNSSHFIVERSGNGSEFKDLATVKAAGNSSNIQEYVYLDKSHLSQISYYRLKQVDLDGSFSYSPIVAVRSTKTIAEVTAYPNPFDRAITLELTGDKASGKAQVMISSLEGKIIYQTELKLTEGKQQVELTDLPKLPAGMYLIRVQQDEKLTVLKVTKQ